MRKILFRILIVIFLFNISFSLSDYYKKVYTLKINKTELFTAVNASDKQQNELNKIFAKYQKKAEEVANQPFSYTKKVSSLNSIRTSRKEDIYKVLSHDQIKKYNAFMNEKRLEFEERNNKIADIITSLNLTHDQKAGILRYENEFQRNIDDLIEQNPANDYFTDQYNNLKRARNDKIAELLSEDQLTVIQDRKFFQ
ncbi:viral A-type inclusion protein [Sebaldella termitidis]|uniref:viral A-type inclusion protein n=1 Tax=Sebaldella termitidis TaxID=826 RepID=UPI003EBE654B